MPKKVVSPLIIEGMYEYILRINLLPFSREQCKNDGDKQVYCEGVFYIIWEFPKRQYELEDVEKERNRLLDHYEKLKFRGKKGYKSTKLRQISQ